MPSLWPAIMMTLINLQLYCCLVALIVALYLVYVHVYRRRLVKSVCHYSTVPEIPFLCPAELLRLNFDNTLPFVRSLAQKFPLRCWLGPFQLLIGITDPEDVATVMGDPEACDKPYVYDFFNSSRGLLSSQYSIWKQHRKILNPAFSLVNIKAMIPTFRSRSEAMLKRIDGLPEGVACELSHFVRATLIETALVSFAGVTYDQARVDEYCGHLNDRVKFVSMRFLSFVCHIQSLYKLTGHYAPEQRCVHFMKHFAWQLVENAQGSASVDRKLFIDLLIARWKEGVISREDMLDELDTILYTSVDTSTQLIVNTLLMIARHPEVQQRIVDELKQVFSSPDTPFDYDSLKQLVYLDRVIKESIRVYPVVPFAVKHTKRPVKLKTVTIPKDVIVLIPIVSMHESAELWGDDVAKFDPDRFTAERSAKRHPNAFIPFAGAAGRNCIGMVYGQLLARTIIASLLIRYRIGTDLMAAEDVRFEYRVTMSLKNKDPFRLWPRDKFYS